MDTKVVFLLAALSVNAAALPQFGQPGLVAPPAQLPNQLGIFQSGPLPSLLSALNPFSAISFATPSVIPVVSNAVASVVLAAPTRVPSSNSALIAPSASERRNPDPQFTVPGVLPSITPAPSLSLGALPTNGLSQVNSVVVGVGNGVSSVLVALPALPTATPKGFTAPITNQLIQDPIKAIQLAYTSLFNAILGGTSGAALAPLTNSLTSLLGNLGLPQIITPIVVKRQDEEETTDDATPEDVAPEDTEADEVAPEDVAPEDTAPEDVSQEDAAPEDESTEDDQDDDAPDDVDADATPEDEDTPEDTTEDVDSDEAPEDENTEDTTEDDFPDDEDSEDVSDDAAPEDETPEDVSDDASPEDVSDDETPDDVSDDVAPEDATPEDVAPVEETPVEESVDDETSEARKLAMRQIPSPVIPSAALVPSGVTDAIAVPGSFAPLVDATPLAVVPISLAALAPNGLVASAAVPPSLISALADPTINPLAVANSVDPLAPLPTQLIPSSAAAAIAAAATALAPPLKRAIEEIAAQQGLQERDVKALQAGIDTAADPQNFIAQYIAAQAKPLLKELGNQIQAAPALFASVAAAQVSMAAGPVSLVQEQIAAAKPLVDAIPSIVQSQLAAAPSAAAPIFSAASSILEDLQSATVGTDNALNALLPNPTLIAGIISGSLPEISVSFEAGVSQISPTDNQPAIITPLPTLLPVVGPPSSSQQQPDFPQQHSPILQQSMAPAQPYTPQQLSSQPLAPHPQQSIFSMLPYQSAAPSQGTNSVTGLLNEIPTAIAAAVTPAQAPAMIELSDNYYVEPTGTNNIIVDPLTQPFSPDTITRLLQNQLYLQVAPILLLVQSFAAVSNPLFALSSLSSSLLQDLGSFSPNPLLDPNRILLASSSSSASSPTLTSPAVDPITRFWLEGAKLLQNNAIFPTRILSPDVDKAADLLNSLLSGSGSSDDISSLLAPFIDSSSSSPLVGEAVEDS